MTDEEMEKWLVTPLDALSYLQQVYRGEVEPDYHKMRAARDALPFEKPKLAVTAVAIGGSFAEQLEARIKKLAEPKLIEMTVERDEG